MVNFDDIFNKQDGKASGTFVPKEEWIARKKAERQAVFERVDEYLEDIKEKGDKLQIYLDVQARFGAYSVSNALLIAAQRPNATKLADFTKWQEQGASVKKGEVAIDILEPGQEYIKRDGTTAVNYNVKKLFDVLQTNAEVKDERVHYEGRELLGALISHAPCRVSLSDKLPENVNAMYQKEQKEIVIRRGLSAANIFRSLTQEIGRVYLEQGEYKALNAAFTVFCVSYILCGRFGVMKDGFNFERLPEEYAWVDNSEIKTDLSTMREIAKEITADIDHGLAEHEKKVKLQEKSLDMEAR